jgi:hypothetical protein
MRIREGNKKLARSVAAFIKRRDKITRLEWETKIRPLMKQTQNDIITTLKSNTLTDWNIFNLTRIQDSIQVFIDRFDAGFKEDLISGQNVMADFTAETVDRNLKYVGLKKPTAIIQSEALVGSMQPLSEGFVTFFTRDLAKVVDAEVSLGVVRGDSVNQVAKSIKDKFAHSTVSYARAERIARTEMLRASSIAQHARNQEILALNPGVRKSWIWSHKPDGRPTHAAAEERYTANPISINKNFSVGGEQGLYPRAYTFSARNTVNCGCTSVNINKNDLEGIKTLSKDIK